MCGGGADATPLFKRVEALLDLFQCNLPCHSNPPDDNTALILMHCVHSKRNGSRLGGCYQSKQLLAATFLVSMLAPSECARAGFCVLWWSLPSPLTPPHLHRFPTLSNRPHQQSLRCSLRRSSFCSTTSASRSPPPLLTKPGRRCGKSVCVDVELRECVVTHVCVCVCARRGVACPGGLWLVHWQPCRPHARMAVTVMMPQRSQSARQRGCCFCRWSL